MAVAEAWDQPPNDRRREEKRSEIQAVRTATKGTICCIPTWPSFDFNCQIVVETATQI
jgi:hypothetical protein